MANKGRVYLRLFERDLGYRPLTTFLYLPNRYKLSGADLLPSNCIRYKLGFFASTVGLVDYDAGLVTYNWTDPTFITPGAFVRLEYRLTGTAAFGQFRMIYGIGTTDMYRFDSGATMTGFPTPNANQNFTWLISPVPSCTPGLLGSAVWRWSDGPPQA